MEYDVFAFGDEIEECIRFLFVLCEGESELICFFFVIGDGG